MDRLKKLCLRVLVLITCIVVAGSVYADVVLASDTSPNFSVSTIRNKYQKKDPGYFDLDLLKVGQKTTLKIKIVNSSNTISIFDVDITDAMTNSNLILDYSGENTSNQSLSGLKLTDYVFARTPIITVKPQSSVEASFDVVMPKEKFEGQIIGGIYLKKHMTKNQKGTRNAFGYVNTVILRSGKQSLQAEPKIIKAGYLARNKVPTVQGTIKNNIQAYANGVEVKETITDDRGKVIESKDYEARAIAPKSQTDTYFQLEKPLNPGKYHFNVEFKRRDKKIIKSSAPFTVGDIDAAAMNANKITLTMLLFIILLLIIVFLLIFVLFDRRRRKKEEKNKR